MGFIVIISAFLLFLALLIYGIYFAPSKIKNTQVMRKLLIPAHSEQQLVATDWLGTPIEETVMMLPRYFLVIIVNGGEEYLQVDREVWEKTSLGAEVDIEYSLLFGCLPYVRKFQMAEKIFI